MASAITFRNTAFTSALNRAPTTTEARQWRTALNCSTAIGDTARLALDAGNLITALFLSAEYIARARTDAQFLTDSYGAYFARTPDGADSAFWLPVIAVSTRASICEIFAAFEALVDRATPLGLDLSGNIDPFPTPDFGGPRPSKQSEAAPDFSKVTNMREFQDGGRSFSTSAGLATRMWALEYQWFEIGSLAQALDDHRNASFEVLGFDFTDRYGVTHTDVHYDIQGMDKDHRTIDDPTRIIRLIKTP